MSVIRVLVVDDSPSMRHLIRTVLADTRDIAVVGEAADPIEARAAVKALDPDVITLDVEMPRMNGLEFLTRLMRLRPTPVIMVSNLTAAGGDATIQALEAGAVDCVSKPRLGDAALFPTLADKIRIAAEADLGAAPRGAMPAAPRTAASLPAFQPDGRILAIGSSTGGVEALTAILTTFPANCPPTVITQHMPPDFTRIFAERLNRLCAPTISEANDGAPLRPGQVYIAPGDPTRHLEIGGVTQWRCRFRPGPTVNGHCPSVDVLFRSVARSARSRAVGVILTGMGRDGAEGLLAMREAGAATIGQDARSSLVYGMPKVAFETGAVERQLPLRDIGAALLTLMRL